MDIFNLFWIFLVIASLIPALRKRMLDASRVRTLRALEEKRNSRAIALIHHQETLSLLGFPLARYIDIQDSEQVLRAIKLTDPDLPIDVILHTPGGLVLAAEQIAYALCRHPATVTVFVPHYAMSGGTLIALSADELVMDDNAVLGPVDPQIGQQPAVSVLSVIERKPIAEVDDQTLIWADVAHKAIKQVRRTLLDILTDRMEPERARSLTRALVSGQWTHDYPIFVKEARELGLSVSTDMPKEVYDLMSLYPQAAGRRPSVEYIPTPYGPPERGPQPAGKGLLGW